MVILAVAVGGNLAFVILLAMAYVFVTRRREKVYLLVEHLASLARRGMPLQTGLRMLGKDLGGYFGTQVDRVARRVEEGVPLGEAFMAAPRTFPPLLRSMVAMGEKGGNLAGFLEEVRRSYRRIVELPYQSVYFFLYPILLSIVINLAMTGMYVGIGPRMAEIFRQTGVDTTYMRWWPILMGANEAVLGLCVAMALLVFTGGTSVHFSIPLFRFLKRLLDRIVLWTPVLGGLVRDGSIQHFSLSVGLFLRAGASLPEAVLAAAGAERNEVYRRRYERMAAGLAEGARLSTRLLKERVFPDDLLWFVETGEAAGSLPEHLLQAAVHYDTKSRFAAQVAMRAMIPLFVLLNGALVLGLCLLTFYPLTNSLYATMRW